MMNPIQHVRVKIFASEAGVDLGEAIPVFHRWIREGVCEEMLIDVADYRHVPAGPGVMLIGYEGHYSLDESGGRLGLLYARKAPGGEAQENLRQAYDAAVAACRRLEAEVPFQGKLRFDVRNCEIAINDRLLAPNTDETFAALRGEFEEFARGMWGANASIQRAGTPRELFKVRVAA
ncbi:MAG: hypothetical protein ABIZ80_25525 [Bryobacteraceae bacterium]